MNGTDAFFSFVRSLLARRWVRFGMVGGTAALCYALLGLLFVNVLGLPALVGNGLAYVLEGNLFKMCSWGGRITRYWIKYCRDYASSAEAVKIGINAK